MENFVRIKKVGPVFGLECLKTGFSFYKGDNILQIKHLTVTHKKDLHTLLEDVSFVLEQGDKMAVIGEEGNGKSTLLKLIYEPDIAEAYVEYQGEILTGNAVIGYLAQELKQEQKEQTVWEFCSENPAFYDQNPRELADIARKLGILPEFFYRQEKMGELSGGEKVKVQLAGIMMQRPDIILMDEPSNDLDLETLEFLEKFILETQAGILYVSHDETLIERTANKILHLEQLRRKSRCRYTVANMDYKTYMENRSREFTNQERVAGKQREEFAKQQERFLRIQQKVEHQQNAISRQDPHGGQLLKKKMHAVKSMERRFEKEKEEFLEFPEQEDAIFLRFAKDCAVPKGKIVLNYSLDVLEAGGEILARDIVLWVQGPVHVGIIGKNGCGKTTLLRKIAENLLERKDIKTAYMPQNYEEIMDLEKTAVNFLVKTGDKEEEKRIRTYLGSMKYTAEEMTHPMRELSGGQKAKLFLLKMSMEGSQVLVLDEPTRNFSPLSNPVIRKNLTEFPGAIISVSHDRKYLKEVCHVIYELTETGLRK